jgi:hypothetical protein
MGLGTAPSGCGYPKAISRTSSFDQSCGYDSYQKGYNIGPLAAEIATNPED